MIKIINHTEFDTKDIKKISDALVVSQSYPSCYLICIPLYMNGIAITNIDKPFIIIRIKDLEQFAETFVHELTHLQQHQKGYVDEDEAYEKEIIVSGLIKSKNVKNGKF